MLPLLELQQMFKDWVLRGDNQYRNMSEVLPDSFDIAQDMLSTNGTLESNSAGLFNAIKTNGLTAEQRLSVYRNNTQLGLIEALRDGYPVVNKLVGTDFFNQMAKDYIRRFPSKEGCLLFFGQWFSHFIQAYPPASSLPYLPDVARLEWLWHEAFHEADASPLAITILADIAPELYGMLSLWLHPSARLLTSDYPVLTIWQSNQDDISCNKDINLDEGGCQLLVFRPEWEVVIVNLDVAEFIFLTEMQQGSSINQAAEYALTADGSFNLLGLLERGFGLGLFTDYL